MFDEITALYEPGYRATEIARKLGLGPRRVYRWVRRIDLPEPNAMASKACTPAYFVAFLARCWPKARSKLGICSLTSIIEATAAPIVILRASLLRGAVAHGRGVRASCFLWTRKPRRRRVCERWTR